MESRIERARRYAVLAEEAEKVAATNPTYRDSYLDIARAWRDLADQVKRDDMQIKS